MSTGTCIYVASKTDPKSWHGTEQAEFYLDKGPSQGGLGITEWHCPHPSLGQKEGDGEYCAFHTETEVRADVQQAALLDALNDAGDRPRANRPEHRGQFVGATFGGIELTDKTITATDDYGVRFDHAQFRADGENLDFTRTRFVARRQHDISFYGAEFSTTGGHVWFGGATFETTGDGDVRFEDATFTATGDVWFKDATFTATDDGGVRFTRAMFETTGDGDVGFEDTTLINADFREIDFADADFRGATLAGTNIQEADIQSISVDGATTCTRLYEGYGSDHSTAGLLVPARVQRLYRGSAFDAENWDATARAYHQLKTVFGEHGLVSKARRMHVRERRARSLEAKADKRRVNSRYLGSLPSRFITGYGVRIQNLLLWMGFLFLVSTAVYIDAGVRDTYLENTAYSVLAFTVAPPPPMPSGVSPKYMMMIETFFGTLSIVLLGYILGNREQF